MKRPMRTLLVILLLLVSGAVVNIAVAWGMEYGQRRGLLAIQTRRLLQTQTNPHFGVAITDDADARLSKIFAPIQAGWPTPSLCRYFWIDMPGVSRPSNLTIGLAAPALPRWSGGRTSVRLPIRPLWPGFAINTVFYAGLLWLLFAAPFALRRRRRIKRGRCPACAYPVGPSEVCTECGKPVGAKAVACAVSAAT
jgi:hypothetical protein